MKKKIIYGVLFFFILALNIICVFETDENDLSLNSLLQNARANESESGIPKPCDAIWTVTYTFGNVTSYSCTTGGSFQCPSCILALVYL
jgi:hypothetical protein